MNDDYRCLRQFARAGSQKAFAEVVSHHLDFVYAVALRQVARDRHLAQDVTQQVFITLARKAGSITEDTVMTGWLYRVTKYLAIDAVRSEQRRRRRETVASLEADIFYERESQTDWTSLHPMLDQVLGELKERDQDALMLRFFEGRSLAEVGRKLNLSEDAARMRIERSLKKVRMRLSRLGVISTTTAVATIIAQSSVAAPAGLAASISGEVVALAGAGSIGAGVGVIKGVGLGKTLLGVGTVAVMTAVGVWMHTNAQPNVSDPLFATQLAGELSGDSTSEPLSAGNREADKAVRQDARKAAKAFSSREEKVLASVRRRIEPFFEQQHLTADQQAKLTQLMVAEHEASIDLAAAEAKNGRNVSENEPEFRMRVDALRGGLDTEIKGLLGDTAYASYSDYNLAMRQRATIEQVQANLAKASEPLTPAQSDSLRIVLQSSKAFKLDDSVIAGAKSFLSDAQIQMLQSTQQRANLGSAKPSIQKAVRETRAQ